MIFGWTRRNSGMKTKEEIFKDILRSSKTNCVLKIKIKDIPNPVITAVHRLEKNKVILKPTCLYGYELKKRTITLDKIEEVIRYRTNFNSPIFEKLRFIKNNISAMRQNFNAFQENSSVLPPA
jgi:hypothetical protein